MTEGVQVVKTLRPDSQGMFASRLHLLQVWLTSVYLTVNVLLNLRKGRPITNPLPMSCDNVSKQSATTAVSKRIRTELT